MSGDYVPPKSLGEHHNRRWERAGGRIESYRDHGVFVRDGLTAREIMLGADVLERQFDVEPFVSRAMVTAVLRAIKAAEATS